jgi:protein required for attachment to host cells
MTTWILVADSSRARCFAAEHPNSPLDELSDSIYPQARLHDAALTTDTDNRGRSPKGHGSHGAGDHPPIKEELREAFAGSLCQQLERQHRRGAFQKLYMVAPPTFLGVLRRTRGQELDQVLAGELAKDVCHRTPAEIRKILPRYL